MSTLTKHSQAIIELRIRKLKVSLHSHDPSIAEIITVLGIVSTNRVRWDVFWKYHVCDEESQGQKRHNGQVHLQEQSFLQLRLHSRSLVGIWSIFNPFLRTLTSYLWFLIYSVSHLCHLSVLQMAVVIERT
jgi:hypothetical protein